MLQSPLSKSIVRTLIRASVALAVMLQACAGTPRFQAAGKTDHLSDTSGDQQTIAILGMNDFHGALLARELKSPEPHSAGGASVLARHAEILREVFGPNFFVMDAGDQFQGTLESNAQEGKPVVEFFNQLGMSVAAVGNHEFDFGPEGEARAGTPGTDLRGALKARMKEARYPYVAANIRYKNGGELADFPNLKPSVMLTAGRLKIGVIGLATLSTPVTTRPEHVGDLVFTSATEATLREARKLRKDGAHIVIVLAHQGLRCDRMRPEPGILHKPNDSEGSCDSHDEIPELLKAIPKGTVDAVIAGHTHQIVHHYVQGVPVIEAGANGQYYNLLYLTYDWQQKKLVSPETTIEGPVPVCEKVFENQGDCNALRPAPRNGRGSLVTPKFHGASIRPLGSVESWARQVAASVDSIKARVVGSAAGPLLHDRTRESPLGNFITDAMRESLKADVAICNPGGIRASIEAGEIRYEDVFRSFPFDNDVVTVLMNEAQLKLLLRVTQSGARGYFPVSGLQVTLLDFAESTEGTDLNRDRKIEPWEMDRLVSVTLPDGSPLDKKKLYRVAIPDFLVSGGDDLGWIMSQIPKSQIIREGAVYMRDAAIAHLAALPGVNSEAQPLVDPAKPRLIFTKQKPRGGKSGKSGGGRRHRRRHK